MSQVEEMMSTLKTGSSQRGQSIARCIEACLACLATCNACADACLAEAHVDKLRRCIRLNLDCADLCAVTARLMGRATEPDSSSRRALLDVCGRACSACEAECRKHASMHEHCRVCADACAQCARECQALLGGMAATQSS